LLSEDVATQLAIRLNADKLIGFCSEQGVVDNQGHILAELFPNEAETILGKLETDLNPKDGNSTGTMRFLRGAISACKAGVPRSHLISYKEDGALIQELFSFDGIGTQVVMASSEQIRDAEIDDIGGIMDLIHPLEEEGILVRRSREQLEQEVAQFTIIEKDGLVIACAALYPFPEDGMAEMGCVAVHPDYRDGDRGVTLLNRLRFKAKQFKLSQLFVLTTRSLHWFREQGFVEVDVSQLPMTKQKLYNYQRKSKILVLKEL
jgi:amino-acid N-acetyltransferase